MVSINKQKFFLMQILKDIYSDIELANCLGFKGSTAYGNATGRLHTEMHRASRKHE